MQRTSVICSVIWRAGRGAVALVLALATLVAFAGPAWADTHMDESFSEDGARILNRTSKNDEARSLAFRSDGSVVLGGWDDNNHSSWKALRMVTIAIAADGTGSGPFCGSSSCDPKTDRKTWSPLTDSAEEVLLLSDGRYAFVGHAGDSGNKYDCVVVVRDTDASLDTSFASNGKSDVRFSTSENDQCYAGALQSDGKIVVGGWVYTSSSTGRNLALARVNPSDGSLDTSFGSGGKVVYNAGGNGEHIKAIDVQPDGKILVAGTGYDARNGALCIGAEADDWLQVIKARRCLHTSVMKLPNEFHSMYFSPGRPALIKDYEEALNLPTEYESEHSYSTLTLINQEFFLGGTPSGGHVGPVGLHFFNLWGAHKTGVPNRTFGASDDLKSMLADLTRALWAGEVPAS